MGDTVKGVQVIQQSLYEDPGTTSRGYGEIRLLVRNSGSEAQRVYLRWPGEVYRSGDATLGSCSRELELAPGQSAELSLFWPGIELAGMSSNLLIRVDDKSQYMDIQNNLEHVVSQSGNSWSHSLDEQGPTILCDRALDIDFRNELRDCFDPIIDPSMPSMPVPSTPTPSTGYTGSLGYPGTLYGNASIIRPTASAGDWSTNWISYQRFDAVVLKAESYDDLSSGARTALADYVSAGGLVWIVYDERYTDDMFTEVRRAQGLGLVEIGPPSINSEFASLVDLRSNQHEVLTYDQADERLPLVERGRVPTRLMSVLLIIYAIAIGPVLLFVLSKKRRRIWILWIIPAVSLMICFTVGTWAYYREGIHGHARMCLLTVLDQTNDRATTHGLVGFYTPVTDGRGLQFSTSSILEPQWQPGYSAHSYGYYEEYEGSPLRGLVHMDWNSGQHLGQGWLQAKTPIHFQIWKVERRREELTITSNSSTSIDVTNALGADIRSLEIHLPDGTYASVDHIPAGEQVTLPRLSTRASIRPGVSLQGLNERLIRMDEDSLTDFNTSGVQLAPGSYIAIIDGHPFVETAITNPKTDRGETILFGRFELEE